MIQPINLPSCDILNSEFCNSVYLVLRVRHNYDELAYIVAHAYNIMCTK